MNKCMICDKLENRNDEFICDECYEELEEFAEKCMEEENV